MKIILTIIVVASIQLPSFSQKINPDSIAHKRNQLNQRNMLALGTWATGNIVYGSIAAPNHIGDEKYFHRMNVYWNTVNLGLAGASYFLAKKKTHQIISLEQNLKEQKRLEKILLINTGLDVGYMLTGFYFQNRSQQQNLTENKYQMKGYGQSLVMQGTFLLAFDILQYFQHRKNGKGLGSFANKTSLGFTGQSVAFNYRF